MKKISLILAIIILPIIVKAQPTIDGSFDGVGVWGSAISTSDATAGWAGVNIGNLHITSDDTYYYFAIGISGVADWQSWGVVINTISSGGSNEAWGYPITYGHSDLPNHVIKGHFGQGGSSYAEHRTNDGASFSTNIGALAATEFNADEANSFIEIRITRENLGFPIALQAQAYITGNNGSEHATFDAVPNDENADSWNDATTLDTYSSFYYVETAIITGSEGWRILSSPVSGATYANLLDPFWTQGIATGADATNGTANVMTYNGSSLTPVTDLTSTLSAGQGFIAYIYSDDNFDGSAEGFPKTISITGTENSGPVTPTLTSGASAWSLVGNPYASTIDWESITKSDVSGTVYVYDHGYTSGGSPDETNATGGAFRAWNGSAGGLTNGLIAPFQGFWVQNAASGTPNLEIPTSAKTTGGTLYKEAPKSVIQFAAKMGLLESSAYFSFNENATEGLDNWDAYKLTPYDLKNYLSLATSAEGSLLDINNLPNSLTERVEIPLYVQAFEATSTNWKSMGGEVTLSWPKIENLPSGWGVELVDYQTNNRIDLTTQASYTFELSASTQKVAYDHSLLPKSLSATTDARFGVVVGPITTSVRELNEIPNAVVLHQNYPNPFNPTTQISFELPQAMQVKLTVFDMLGREVATLLNNAASAGLTTVNWNAARASSGIYYYRLQAGNTVVTKKMTLIK